MDIDKITKLLGELGDSGKEIATKLLALNCKGVRCHMGQCPIATYLKSKDIMVAVSAAFVAPYVGARRADSMHTPGPIATFIEAFDAGAFPELVE